MLNQRGNWMKLMIQRWILGVFGCDQDLLWDGDSIQYSICLYGFVLKMGYTPSYVNFKSSSWWNTPPETFFFCLGVRTHIWDHTMGVCNMTRLDHQFPGILLALSTSLPRRWEYANVPVEGSGWMEGRGEAMFGKGVLSLHGHSLLDCLLFWG